MEGSHILRGMEDEEQSSSESGWTMYIGSSIHENDHCNNYVGGEYSYNTYKQEGFNKNQCPNNNDDESDDSMASDASSGPSYHKLPSSSEPNLGMDQYYKHDESAKSIVSTEKLHKQAIKRDQRRIKSGKEKLDRIKTISAPSRVQRGGISKANYMSQEDS